MAGKIDFFRVAFPYCLQRQPDGSYVCLNRKYKPIGFTTSTTEWVKYEDYPVALRLVGLTPAVIRSLSSMGSDEEDMIHLYTDATDPSIGDREMAQYMVRLRRLAELQVAVD